MSPERLQSRFLIAPEVQEAAWPRPAGLSVRRFHDQDTSGWASDLASAAVKPLAAVVGKAAEGGANALLVLRLGACAKKAFRPLK